MKRKLCSWRFIRLFLVSCMILLLDVGLFAQNAYVIKGTVTDANSKEPLVGVTIAEKGQPNGTISDLDGNFTIKTNPKATLTFSYIGYRTQEVKADKTAISVELKENAQVTNEVVVVGYGTQKKVNLTGAISQIDGDAISSKTAPNVMAAMQGELPGVTITRSSGKPGDEGYGMKIRGISSANDANALVLIDGMEGDMSLLNPNDIESISILKDAAAASIYGAKAAAGVVLITTKKGQEGAVKVSYNGYFALTTPGNMPERLNSWDEQKINDIARVNATGKAEFTEEQVEWLKNPNFNYRPNIAGQDRWDYYDNTNYIKEGLNQVSQMQSHSVSLNGGSKQLNYLASAGYYKRDGLLKYGPDGNERYNLRLNLNSEISKYVNMSFLASYNGSFIDENANGTNMILDELYRIRTRQPIYTPGEDTTGNIYNGDLQVNPIDVMKNGGKAIKQYEAFNGKADITIHNVIKGLVINGMVARTQDYYSYDSQKRTLKWYGMTPNTVRNSINVPNSLTRTKNRAFHNTYQATANYEFALADKHNFKLLGGTSFEEYRKDEISASASTMINNDFFSFNYADVLTKTNSDKIETWAMNSYFGRLNYNYAEKYLFEANVRYDGSSRLAPESRWEVFPSFSAGWRLSEENFIQNSLPVVSNLKLRASWGQLGNGAVLGLYDYIPLIDKGSSLVFNDAQALYYYQGTLASKSKTWETIETSDIGLDLGLFNNKLNVTADYYMKQNKNMLATLQVPSIIGVGVSTANVGELKTWGWEVDVKWKDKINDFEYWVGFNLSDSQNELVKYDGKNTVSAGTVGLLEGYPLNSIWGYKTDGYFQEAGEYAAYGVEQFNHAKVGPGDVKYLDLDGSKKIDSGEGTPQNPGDLVCLGNTNPRYTYGINLGFQWKGFDFSAFFQGVGKRNFLIETATLAPMLNTYNLPWSIHQDYWTEDNRNAFWPRLYLQNDFNYKPSDKWVQDGSYIRLKNVQLGYLVPVNKKYIQKLRVYLSGDDLWEHSKVLDVIDPESSNNVASGMYPFFRTVSLGLNLTF